LQKGFVIIPRSSNGERQQRNIMLDGIVISDDDMAEIDNLRSKDEGFKQCWNPSNII